MPFYVFTCKNDHEFERRMTMEEFDKDKQVRCPECKSKGIRQPAGFLEDNSTRTPTPMGRNRRWKSHPW